jgi:hypothetical protein
MDDLSMREGAGHSTCIQDACESDSIWGDSGVPHLLEAIYGRLSFAASNASCQESVPSDGSLQGEVMEHLPSIWEIATFGIHAYQATPEMGAFGEEAALQDMRMYLDSGGEVLLLGASLEDGEDLCNLFMGLAHSAGSSAWSMDAEQSNILFFLLIYIYSFVVWMGSLSNAKFDSRVCIRFSDDSRSRSRSEVRECSKTWMKEWYSTYVGNALKEMIEI